MPTNESGILGFQVDPDESEQGRQRQGMDDASSRIVALSNLTDSDDDTRTEEEFDEIVIHDIEMLFVNRMSSVNRTNGGFITDASQMEVTGRIQSGSFELQALIPRTQHREQVGLTRLVGFF